MCEHPQAALINNELAKPDAIRPSNRAIGRMFGVSRDSVSRHVFKMHDGYTPPDQAGRKGTQMTGETELDRLRQIRERLEEEFAQRARPETSRELRQVNQRIAELEGSDRPRSVTVADVAGLPEQVARWFAALEPFPDARRAMFEATDPALLEAAGVEAK